MSNSRINRVKLVVTIMLEALAESPESFIPLGHLYAACMSVVDYEDFSLAVKIAGEAGWVRSTVETVTILPAGLELVQSAKSEVAQKV